MDATNRWLAGGSYFLPRQLAGPSQLEMGDVMYPPVALWLFAPFTVLPAILWWAVPAAVTISAFGRLRPAPWAIALSLVVLVYPKYLALWFDGNPGMYVIAAIAAAAEWGTPASLALFKPSMLPLAMFGVRTQGWWYGTSALIVLSLPFIALTLTWIRVVLDAQGAGLAYSVIDMPLTALPLLWWAASSARAPRRSSSGRGGTVPPRQHGASSAA
jgi:hypothetical protein